MFLDCMIGDVRDGVLADFLNINYKTHNSQLDLFQGYALRSGPSFFFKVIIRFGSTAFCQTGRIKPKCVGRLFIRQNTEVSEFYICLRRLLLSAQRVQDIDLYQSSRYLVFKAAYYN